MVKRILLLTAVLFAASSSFAVETKDVASGVTADEMAQLLTGPGITITNAKITGSSNAIGRFSGGLADGLTVDSGVILSSGDIRTSAGPNTFEATSGTMSEPGDAALNSLVSPYQTHDAVILEFDAVTQTSNFSIRYIFASEEYKEYVGTEYNDVFAFFVDGANIAIVPGTTEPVAVNTINHVLNMGLYADNPPFSNNFGTSFDGFTTELTAVTVVQPGTPHHIRLAIADTSDSILDSAVFLAAGGISGLGAAAVVPEFSEIAVYTGEKNTMNVTVYGIPDEVTPVLSASGLPADSTVTFTPNGLAGPRTPIYRMETTIGPDTAGAEYPLIIRADVGAASAFAHVNVIVDCVPPFILSIPGYQPSSTEVPSGSSATLSVVAGGSGSFRYQWYIGHSGSVAFPVNGDGSATLLTPPITSTTEYWVRVTNACGSIDSSTAVVKAIPQAPLTIEPPPDPPSHD